ncbi:MAG: XRE family transcriptional regulator [Acidobacteria bacterium]|nr:MAG: XRE family transcriptional regulator [Acidobacteriota bacterium]
MTHPTLRKTLGQAIRLRREALGQSQEGFARTVGLHRTYLGAIERGERNPALDNLVRIAAGLKVPLSTLFEEAERLDELGNG